MAAKSKSQAPATAQPVRPAKRPRKLDPAEKHRRALVRAMRSQTKAPLLEHQAEYAAAHYLYQADIDGIRLVLRTLSIPGKQLVGSAEAADRKRADEMADVLTANDASVKRLRSLADQLESARNRLSTALLVRDDVAEVLFDAVGRRRRMDKVVQGVEEYAANTAPESSILSTEPEKRAASNAARIPIRDVSHEIEEGIYNVKAVLLGAAAIAEGRIGAENEELDSYLTLSRILDMSDGHLEKLLNTVDLKLRADSISLEAQS